MGVERKPELDFVELDPTKRYGRYGNLLGSGSTKKVYQAFDQDEGKEVAWNQIQLRRFVDNKDMIKRLCNEAELLSCLRHKNIISSFAHWTHLEQSTLNFVTEVCTSGNLREYHKKHRRVSIWAIKNWSRQILKGLEYLHSHEPCVIHRDLNCSNIFINGNTGKIKIGDLGFSGLVGKDHVAHSFLGTPEYMAPELYEEEYTEAVDIYSFGMCLLELVTNEIPYTKCDSVVKIYKKVICGVKPQALDKLQHLEAKVLIEKCLARKSDRPSVS